MHVHIRGATADDFPGLQDIYRRASLANPGDRAALAANPDALTFAGEGVPEGRTRVAVNDDGAIVGFATVATKANDFELEDLFVDPELHRHGVGRRLVADVAAISRVRGLQGIDVTANPAAMAFYRATGFVGDETVATEFGSGTRMRLATPAGVPPLPAAPPASPQWRPSDLYVPALPRRQRRFFFGSNMVTAVGLVLLAVGRSIEFSGHHGDATGSSGGWLLLGLGGAMALVGLSVASRLLWRGRRMVRSQSGGERSGRPSRSLSAGADHPRRLGQ